MHVIFDRLVTANYPHNWESGPQQMRLRGPEAGINCVAQSHLALEGLFGIKLPATLHCNEMHMDIAGRGDFFRPVQDGLQAMQVGDVILTGVDGHHSILDRFSPVYDNDGFLRNWRKSPLRHVNVFTGEYDPTTGQPLVLDTSPETAAGIRPFDEVMASDSQGLHAKVFTVGRLILAPTIQQGAAA